MLHARNDYNRTIQQCNKEALRALFEDMIGDAVADDAQRDSYRLRFESAMAETIPALEPVFLLRSQDEMAASAVRAYAHLHQLNGGADPIYTAAMEQASAMDRWPKKKKADMLAEHLRTEDRTATTEETL